MRECPHRELLQKYINDVFGANVLTAKRVMKVYYFGTVIFTCKNIKLKMFVDRVVRNSDAKVGVANRSYTAGVGGGGNISFFFLADFSSCV